MQTRSKKTLAAGALGLAFAAAAAGTASATSPPVVLGALPVGTSALPANPTSLLPHGNHLDGNHVAPVSGLLGGLPLGG
ncbi:hypothetical protein [Actinacidiphila paucisporea]|uniref:Secreted protein n=1 Tax=Actinacidiphila paucisporea TaxID=310782 RepID=A0A1M6U9Z8_9ACTN|nr:hypothetical protein [Actinacidiphila paucisporea]SHK66072.1 hypothetical protein SAMN05216499_101297 [Actinacidiphila paucisporea]